MADDELEDELHHYFAQLIEQTPSLRPLTFAARSSRRSLAWRTRRRGAWTTGLAAVGVLAVTLAFVLPSSPGIVRDSRLGLTVSGAAVVVPLAPNVTFAPSYVPAGFHLLATVRATDVVTPIDSIQSLSYARGGAESGGGHLVVSIRPTAGTPSLAGVEPGATSTAGPVINGAKSVLVTNHQSGQAITGPCSVLEPNGSKELHVVEQLLWRQPSDVPDVSLTLQVTYLGKAGIAKEDLFRVAEGLRFDVSSWSCWADQAGLLHQTSMVGACAPGQLGSLPTDPFLTGGSVVSRGSLYGSPWEFVVATEKCNLSQKGAPASVTAFGLVGRNDLLCGDPGTSTAGFHQSEAYVDVVNLASGERVACGSVPAAVSTVTIVSKGGAGVSEPVLPIHRAGSAFFVMSLGKVGAACYYVCRGSVTVRLYAGSRLISSHTWQPSATENSAASYAVGRS
jgi:hypothetical protein